MVDGSGEVIALSVMLSSEAVASCNVPISSFVSCSLPKYLGCIEVFESRGMTVCEEACKALRAVSLSLEFFIMKLLKQEVFKFN
jgi:hypothetical protein